MPNYANGKIYKITAGGMTYIGSTTLKLSQRLADHRNSKRNIPKNISSHPLLDLEDCQITLIEDCPCERREQLLMRERHWILNTDCVNKTIPIRTTDDEKEYRQNYQKKNAEHIKEFKKQYWEDNKDKLKDYNKEWRTKNIDEVRQKARERTVNKKDEIKRNKKQYYEENKEKILERNRLYREANREQINKKQNKKYQEKKNANNI